MAAKRYLFPVLRESVVLFLNRFSLLNKIRINRRSKRGDIIPESEMGNYLEAANEVHISVPLKKLRIGLVKDAEDDFEGYFARRAYWPKYERFLRNNNLTWSYFDIHSSNWQNEAGNYDVIIWHPRSSPDFQAEAESKYYFLEKYLKKICFPSFDELWSYEDKIRSYYLYSNFGLPVVPTFISNSRTEAMEFINSTVYPIISKIATGSSSFGVRMIKNKRSAFNYVNYCFSKVGKKTYWPFARQINYVYFQQFVENAKYDLRIIVVGNKAVGYYRYPKSGDFRASGAGILEKKALPEEAMKIAFRTKQLLRATSLAVDMIYSEQTKTFNIIETSVFCGIDTAEQLIIDGIPGYYEFDGESFTFREGRFWVQEMALKDFFEGL